jgi:DNA-binding Xre family transcriptional regulator
VGIAEIKRSLFVFRSWGESDDSMKANQNMIKINKNPITPKQIKAIYCDRQRSQYQLAEQYRISQPLVSMIRSNKRHSALTRDLPQYVRKDYRHERSGRRKLTPPQVKDIFTSQLSKKTLTKAYGIDRRTVERIRKGELHSHLTQNLSRL